ncbi:aminotransferase class I/II-fold pyridoxal phosphate-dependent enzyme, partial [Piscirickettsia litoralis]|uniref:aminotransferase class I/II-fold pyridoxal phosphate-dependent enzyme n=1 Tax=Piscirickettsia litoralis TaxID=1891921 RepID=UPI001112EDD0
MTEEIDYQLFSTPKPGWTRLGDNENTYVDQEEAQYPSVSYQALATRYLNVLNLLEPGFNEHIKEDHICFGAPGLSSLIEILARALTRPKDSVCLLSPSFFLFKSAAKFNDLNIIEVCLQGESLNDFNYQEILKSKSKLIFICQPNNPIGSNINRDAILNLLENYAGFIFIDEAYQEFSDQQSWAHYIHQYPNLIIGRTFSKALGLASIRIGALIAQPALLHCVKKLILPYAIAGP